MEEDFFASLSSDESEEDEVAQELQISFQRAERFLEHCEMLEFTSELKAIRDLMQYEKRYSSTTQFKNLLVQGVKVAALKQDAIALHQFATLTHNEKIIKDIFEAMLQAQALKEAINFCALYQPKTQSSNPYSPSLDVWKLLVKVLIDAKRYKQAITLVRYIQSETSQSYMAKIILSKLDVEKDAECWFRSLAFALNPICNDSSEKQCLDKTITYFLTVDPQVISQCIARINHSGVQIHIWQELMFQLLAKELFIEIDNLIDHSPYSVKLKTQSTLSCLKSIDSYETLCELNETQYKLLEPVIVKYFVERHNNDNTEVVLSNLEKCHRKLKNYGRSFIKTIAVDFCDMMPHEMTLAIYRQYDFLVTVKENRIMIINSDLLPEEILNEIKKYTTQQFILEFDETFGKIKNQTLHPNHELYEKWCSCFKKLIMLGKLKLALEHIQKLRRKGYRTKFIHILLSQILAAGRFDLLQDLTSEIVEEKLRRACSNFFRAHKKDASPLKYLMALVQMASSTKFTITIAILEPVVTNYWDNEEFSAQALSQLFKCKVRELYNHSKLSKEAYDWINEFLANHISKQYGTQPSKLLKKINQWDIPHDDPLLIKLFQNCSANPDCHDSAVQLTVKMLDTWSLFVERIIEGIQETLSHLPLIHSSEILNKMSKALDDNSSLNFELICTGTGKNVLDRRTVESINFVARLPSESAKTTLLVDAYFDTLFSENIRFNTQCLHALTTHTAYQSLIKLNNLIRGNNFPESIILMSTDKILLSIEQLVYFGLQNIIKEIFQRYASVPNFSSSLIPLIETLITHCRNTDKGESDDTNDFLEQFRRIIWLKGCFRVAFNNILNIENCEQIFTIYQNNYDLFNKKHSAEDPLFRFAWGAIAQLANSKKLKTAKGFALDLIQLNPFASANHIGSLIDAFLAYDAISYSKALIKDEKNALENSGHPLHWLHKNVNQIADYFHQRKRFIAMRNWLTRPLTLSILNLKLIDWIVICITEKKIRIAFDLFDSINTKKLSQNQTSYIQEFIDVKAITFAWKLLSVLKDNNQLVISVRVAYEAKIDSLFFDLLYEIIPHEYVTKLQLYLQKTIPDILNICSENFEIHVSERRNSIIVELRSLLDKAFLCFCRTTKPDKKYKQAYFPVVPEIPEGKTLAVQLETYFKKFLKEAEFAIDHPELFRFFLYIQPLHNEDFIWLSQLYPLANIQKHVKDLIRTPELNEIPIKMQQFLPKVARGIIFLLLNLFSTTQPNPRLAKTLLHYMALRYPKDPFQKSIFTFSTSTQSRFFSQGDQLRTQPFSMVEKPCRSKK